MKKVFFTIQLAFLLTSTALFSQQSENPVMAKFLIEGGIEYGGDEILKVLFTNGGDQTMKAGQGGFLAVGGHFEFNQVKNLMIRASIGVKYNTTAADNANIRLTRFPLVVIPYWKIKDNFRVGIGVTSHQQVRLKGDGFFSDVDFKSSIGPRFEFGYKWVALTYTAVNYKVKNDDTYSASSIGMSASFVLPSGKQKSKK
jgi:hypothetical protein